MDPRKQKRLGPAPIASFEKSFEDNSSPNIGTGLQHGGSQHGVDTIEINGDKMEPLGNAAQTTTNGSKEVSQQQQQQQQQPSISVTQTSTSVGKTRPPPLKATTKATTTLVSSGEQQVTFRGATTLTTPATPRIELSRASSSSYHEEDSRESSPENVFEQVGTGTLQEAIGLGFREEGALELRSSTEELYFMDAEQKREEQEKLQQQQLQQQQLLQQQHQQQMQMQQQPQPQQQSQQQPPKRSSPLMFKFDEHQSYLQQHQRKDSASSEVAALLCISGRTSRISSVGSQGSAVSHLSAVSGVSRSPSPHRMLLETSFCGPKPLENNLADGGRSGNAVAPATAEILEQVLLARKHDPTQVVLAEGIRVESSPKRQPKPTTLSNGEQKVVTKITTQNRPIAGASAKSTMGRQRQSTKSPGQMVIGKTPSGTEYIRINLKPDHMYNDKGIAPHERVVEAPNSLAPVLSKSSTQKKPISLSLGRNAMDETRLTPTASPKPSRHGTLTKDTAASRSPSPGNVSRKSSFNSLFRVGGKDSPDSPRERSRSRSKSKERQAPQSLNATPSKQKSVLAIFKPNKRGSNAGADGKSSKSSSPIDGHDHHPQRSKSNTPLETATGSRPASRLRYYDEPVEGVIHIPLHTPPEEKETRKILQGIAQLTAEPMRPVSAPVTASQLVAAAAALKPVRKGSGTAPTGPRPQQIEKLQRIENLDAIHTLPSLSDDNKECSWSLEVQRHSSSQDSQETVGSDASGASAIRANARTALANILKQSIQENGMAAAAEIHRLPSVDSAKGVVVIESRTEETVTCVKTVQRTAAATEEAIAKEKRRLLFATRLGSGSEEQIFSTQFSISKTESQSSQLSEQVQPQSPAFEHLQRMDTVIRRPEEPTEKIDEVVSNKRALKRLSSSETGTGRTKSLSTSEDEKTPQQTTVAAIVLRHKDSQEELRRKPAHISTLEDDNDVAGAGASTSMTNQRHSRYLENFDVRRKYHENVPRKPKRQSISEAGKVEAAGLEESVETTSKEQRQPKLPQPPPPSTDPSPSPPPTTAAATSQSVASSRTSTPTQILRQRSHSQSPSEKSQSRQTPTKPPRTTTPTRSAENASPQASVKASPQPDRQSVHSTDEPIESSESERDSELAASTTVITVVDPKRRHLPRHVGTIEDHESTGLVSQESFDDELPYIPTTLPEERAQGVAIIPMKERANMELKTCPVDRPRSTTPLNPSHLEEYCGIIAATPPEPTFITSGTPPVRGEKLRISLPRKDAIKEKPQATKSPRRASNASGKTWFEFAEEGLRATGGNLERKDSNKQLLQQKTVVEAATTSRSAVASSVVTTTTKTTAKATTTTTTSTTRKLSGHWIDFENIPEKRKPAKRITALPKDSGSHGTSSLPNGTRNHSAMSASTPAGTHHGHHHAHHSSVPPDVTGVDYHTPHYNYVKPEDCQCECHEARRDSMAATSGAAATETESKPLTNVDLLQQGEDMLPLLDPDIQDGIEPSDSSRELSCYTDDEADAPTRQGSLSRYCAGSNKNNEFPRRDGSRSPRNRKFPDHRYS